MPPVDRYIFNASPAVTLSRKEIHDWPLKVAGAIRTHLGPKLLRKSILNSRFTVSTEFSGMATAEAGFNIASQMRHKLNCSRCEPVIKSCCDIDRLPQSVLLGTGSCFPGRDQDVQTQQVEVQEGHVSFAEDPGHAQSEARKEGILLVAQKGR